MAEDAIITKLRRLLGTGVSSEAETVYLMVEIRKVLEHRDFPADYRGLKFYCDWVAHTRLEKSAAQAMVRLFDQHQAMLEAASSTPDGRCVPAELIVNSAPAVEVMNMSRFRTELGKFLQGDGLPRELTDADTAWSAFMEFYAHVIEDTPLVFKGGSLPLVNEVVLEIVKGNAFLQGKKLVAQWTRQSRTGRKVIAPVAF